MMTVLSLGAGLQSTTVALMAAHGEITPMPDCGIFADTRWESQRTYEHLAWLSSANVLPFPIRRVSRADIREGIRDRRNTTGGRFAAIPWWTVNPDGSHGMGRRQCSSEYKIEPIMREVRQLLGKGMRERIAPGSVSVLIGISTDEAHRMRPARQRYMTNRWPLVERGMSRHDCERWLLRHDYPIPPKSACIGCPFHGDAYWLDMKLNRPDEWNEAVGYDRLLRIGNARGMKAIEFMHRQRVPLDQVDFSKLTDQHNLFGNECEGVCGV